MIRVLFVCHGNICRSPMAEFVMKDMVRRAGLAHRFHIESAATTAEELGNPVYPPARQVLADHGLRCDGKRARMVTREDYARWDYIIGMDAENAFDLKSITGYDPEGKVHLLLDFTDTPRDVADPWYTGNFEATWRDVNAGCAGLLKYIRRQEQREKAK